LNKILSEIRAARRPLIARKERDERGTDCILDAEREDEESVPGPPAARLSREIDHASRCAALRQAWDDKWMQGRHSEEIQNRLNRAQNLKNEYSSNCSQKCK